MGRYVLGFEEVDRTQVAVVGGKGAHLGELSRIEGIRVPAGFCVTTDAYRLIIAEAPSIDDRLDQLSRLKPRDRPAISVLSAEIRRTIEAIDVGHRQLFSDIPVSKWVEEMHPHIFVVHLHDNHGTADEHLPIGDGVVDFGSLLGTIARLGANPIYTLEAHSERDAIRSVDAFTKMAQRYLI